MCQGDGLPTRSIGASARVARNAPSQLTFKVGDARARAGGVLESGTSGIEVARSRSEGGRWGSLGRRRPESPLCILYAHLLIDLEGCIRLDLAKIGP